MKAFTCRVCDNPLYFDNSVCVACGTSLAYSRAERSIVPLDAEGRYSDPSGAVWWVCPNLNLSGCTWLTEDPTEPCFACSLTRTRPNDDDLAGLAQFPAAEQAKRRLLVELDALGLDVVGKDPARGGDPEQGLAFDLMSGQTSEEGVVIGHEDGVVTIDLDEGEDAHREKIRAQLDEPYRTMLGHFRHEVGHYFEWQLIRGDALMNECRELFGDESVDYGAEIQRHYDEGPPADWRDNYISSYATMHPFEDFAETWAHFLHIRATIDTAREHGLTTVASPEAFGSFADFARGVWVPMAIALNQINRSMGKEDLYPFVIPDRVLEKLDFVSRLVTEQRTLVPDEPGQVKRRGWLKRHLK